LPLSSGFRGQLDRAALSVSNNIAEGFERGTTKELVSFLAIARGSGAEVRSMMAVVRERSSLKRFTGQLEEIERMAESCARQLTAWSRTLDSSRERGRKETVEGRRAAKAAKEFRLKFLRELKPEHPLYGSPEAREARGEVDEGD
jgi:four helix bundle protein